MIWQLINGCTYCMEYVRSGWTSFWFRFFNRYHTAPANNTARRIMSSVPKNGSSAAGTSSFWSIFLLSAKSRRQNCYFSDRLLVSSLNTIVNIVSCRLIRSSRKGFYDAQCSGVETMKWIINWIRWMNEWPWHGRWSKCFSLNYCFCAWNNWPLMREGYDKSS